MTIFSSLTIKVSAAVFLCDNSEQVFNRECFRLRTGIWTRSLKQKTGLHQNIISRAIKTLEQKKLIKNVKSVKVRFCTKYTSRNRTSLLKNSLVPYAEDIYAG